MCYNVTCEITGTSRWRDHDMSEEKKKPGRKLTQARREANARYNSKFVEIKVRMTPEHRTEVQEHAASMDESATAFINRAINETMERDNKNRK